MQYKLIKIYGLVRSGNHAISNWIMGMTNERGLFCNNRKVSKNIDQKPSPCSMSSNFRVQARRFNNINTFYDIKNAKKDGFHTIAIGYENFNIKWHNKIIKDLINRKIYQIFGHTEDEISVIILRSPLNILASILDWNYYTVYNKNIGYFEYLNKFLSLSYSRYKEYLKSPKDWYYVRKNIFLRSSSFNLHKQLSVESIINMWPDYAVICTGEKTLKSKKIVPIIFEKWLLSIKYRKKISEQLGFKHNDINLNFVSDAGMKKKFTSTNNISNTEKFNLLNRWKTSSNIKEIYDLIQNNKRITSKFKYIYPIEYNDFINSK